MPTLTPATDSTIAQRYTSKTLEQKGKNKTDLQEAIGWPVEKNRAMVCLPAGMTDKLGGALLKEILPGLLSLPIELLILGKGSKDYGALFTDLAKKEKHRVHIVPHEEDAVRKMYAAADIALFLSDASDLAELGHALRYGVVPVAPECRAIENYNPVQETGNAFTYQNDNAWLCFAALVRALETHKFSFDWRTIQKHCMESIEGSM